MKASRSFAERIFHLPKAPERHLERKIRPATVCPSRRHRPAGGKKMAPPDAGLHADGRAPQPAPPCTGQGPQEDGNGRHCRCRPLPCGTHPRAQSIPNTSLPSWTASVARRSCSLNSTLPRCARAPTAHRQRRRRRLAVIRFIFPFVFFLYTLYIYYSLYIIAIAREDTKTSGHGETSGHKKRRPARRLFFVSAYCCPRIMRRHAL